LRRFYEPLVLLYTLGSTRGEHTHTDPSSEDISHLTLRHLRRIFLTELAYVCDYDKGGDTVTAIGLEFTPQGYVYRVASNTSPRMKIAPFLTLLLNKLKTISERTTVDTSREIEEVAKYCIKFAEPRIKKYKHLLNRCLSKCHGFLLASTEGTEGTFTWLRIWTGDLTPLALCHFAYENRKSIFMHTLANLSAEPRYKSSSDSKDKIFGSIRHYIGRLGHHFRAAATLISCVLRLPDLVENFRVDSITTPPRSTVPLASDKTSLESIIGRMLPANSPDLDRYRRTLVEMDAKYKLSSQFLKNYSSSTLKPRVHAEVQLMDQFYKNSWPFPDNDRYIACSKPACFCCKLYFQHHPGHFEKPASHNKMYLNWRPPGSDNGCDATNAKRQRDILNSITADIRREALRQIDEKAAPHAWHPDSVTGITMTEA
ncbi:hypothetical protein P280DRAFT_358224, partial [Massarina eburnea CBS 473.64]